MYAVRLIQCLNKPWSFVSFARQPSLRNVRPNLVKTYCRGIDFKSQLEKDVVLFRLNRPKYYIFLNLVSGCTCFVWSYLGYFVINTPSFVPLESENPSFMDKIFSTEQKYSHILGGISIIFGVFFFLGTLFYTQRSIKELTLHRGGRFVTILTNKLPGFNSTIKVPLSKISCEESRQRAKGHIPLKVKNRYFYYLLDTKGDFLHPALFDCTAGIKRRF